MLNPLTEAYAKARVDETVRASASTTVVDTWVPTQRATVLSFGDAVGRALVSLGARFLDERSLAEVLEGTAAPPPRAA